MTDQLDQRGGFGLRLDIDGAQALEQPVFLRIARAISLDIRRGRILPGARLPGSRALATSLGVHRNTVLAAYRELMAEGWIEARHGQGTFVCPQLPEVAPRALRKPGPPLTAAGKGAPAFTLPHPPLGPLGIRSYPSGVLRMFGGLPDLRALPHEALARAVRRALRRQPGLLGYADPAGHPQLRAALAGMLRATRGLALDPDGILITRGSQMAVTLASQVLLAPGDVVVVEALGYRPAWQAILRTGARIVPVPVDAHGLSLPRLAAVCEAQRVRAVYLTPHHQYPTTVPLTPARRLALLELARKHRFAVLEDDYDHEFHYGGRPLLPLASADDAGSVVYMGTLSKVFAPGLRVGYVVAAPSVLSQLIRHRYYLDRQGDHVMEAALAELIEDGELQRHTRRMRKLYHARRDTCVSLLRRQLGAALEFAVPDGGMALWVKVAPDIDVAEWLTAAEAAGVVFQAGEQFRWDGKPSQYARLGFAALREPELVEAVRRLVQSLPTRQRRARTRPAS